MLKFKPPFDPGETKDYSPDWTKEMDDSGDTIQTATATIVTPNTGLSVGATTVDVTGKKVVIWFTASNATLLNALIGQVIIISHTVNTTGGRVLNRRIGLKIMRN